MENEIAVYFHCRKCIEELPTGISAQEYQNVEVGLNADGLLIVWCRRHNILVGMIEPKNKLPYKCEKCGG